MWYADEEADPETRTHLLVKGLAGEAFAEIVDKRARDGLDEFVEKIKTFGLSESQLVQVYMAACDYRGSVVGAARHIRMKVEHVIDAALPLDCARDTHSPCCRRP